MPNIIQIRGEYYGYPQCCIDSFIMAKNKDAFTLIEIKYRKELQKARILYSGFIPCNVHLQLILDGKFNSDEVFKNRICKYSPPGAK